MADAKIQSKPKRLNKILFSPTTHQDPDSRAERAKMNPDEGVRGTLLLDFRNRAALANLYRKSSMLTFEVQKIQSSQNIVAKLTSLPFQQCKHAVTTVDGNLQLVGEQHALRFSQMFHLMPTPQGSFYVLNDIFRLNYA
ncbi:nuclear transport factor 2B-like [Juglans microcarpa x Juglans regia]|uniref:nuclear transport factor 2B-like n=1 Tax=Juglans microcarpa x Juglans regia TaxID=2249226 RepID=UPI001B7DC911|nr:nuclear transport factor 2B-like [Juglans microcarpa x Juglans regia]